MSQNKNGAIITCPCGLICNNCEYYNNDGKIQCPGCHNEKGKPFWGECEVYLCANMKKVEHCGLCDEFPCDAIINQFDPNIPKGAQEAIFRIGLLTIRAKIGTEDWIKEIKSGNLPKFDE